MPTATTIFDLSENDLRVILHKMQPDNDKKIADLGIHNLRSRITEWLLKNDFSTMHNFIKDSDGEWKLPERIDCDTCGRYKIGNWKEVVTILKQPLSSNMILDPEKLEQSVELVEIPLTRTEDDCSTPVATSNGPTNGMYVAESTSNDQNPNCWCCQCSNSCARRCNRCRNCCTCCCCCTPILSCLTCNF